MSRELFRLQKVKALPQIWSNHFLTLLILMSTQLIRQVDPITSDTPVLRAQAERIHGRTFTSTSPALQMSDPQAFWKICFIWSNSTHYIPFSTTFSTAYNEWTPMHRHLRSALHNSARVASIMYNNKLTEHFLTKVHSLLWYLSSL